MNRSATIKVISILIIIFLLSVVVRYPNIKESYSTQSGLGATTLNVLQIWEKEGAKKFNYNPIISYGAKNNAFLENMVNHKHYLKDVAGNNYYVAHPQFAYIFPYVVFKALYIKATKLNLRIFHLVINFFSAAFVYLIICLLAIQKPFKKLFVPGVVGFVVYVFSPGVLWFQAIMYTSDIAVQFPFILLVYTVLKLLMRKRFYSFKYLLFYALFLFLMIYTSWLGLFFALAIFVYSMLKLRYQKVFIPLVFITIAISFFTLFIIFKQYSLIHGSKAYVLHLINNFLVLGNLGEVSFMAYILTKMLAIKAVLYAYGISYLPIFMVLAVFTWLGISKEKLGFVFTKHGIRFLWLSTLPILFLHVFFLEYSAQNFIALYGSLFLAVVVGILFDKLKRKKVIVIQKLNGLIFSAVLLSVVMYYYLHVPLF